MEWVKRKFELLRRDSTDVTVTTTNTTTNLSEVKDYYYPLPEKRGFLKKDRDMSFRNDWLLNRMKRYFNGDEVKQVLTNRRSDGSDDAVIAFFYESRTQQARDTA
jgi:hypothetical protein